MDSSKHHNAHAIIGSNFKSLPLRALSPCFILYAGSTITKAKRHFHGFVNIFDNLFRIEKENYLLNLRVRQLCKTGSRGMASVLEDEKREIVKLDIKSVILHSN